MVEREYSYLEGHGGQESVDIAEGATCASVMSRGETNHPNISTDNMHIPRVTCNRIAMHCYKENVPRASRWIRTNLVDHDDTNTRGDLEHIYLVEQTTPPFLYKESI